MLVVVLLVLLLTLQFLTGPTKTGIFALIFAVWKSLQSPQCFNDCLFSVLSGKKIKSGPFRGKLLVAVIPLETRISLVLDFIELLACNPIKVLF